MDSRKILNMAAWTAYCAAMAAMLVGSACVIREMIRIRAEEERYARRAEAWRTIREAHEAAARAKADQSHPARGLVALADMIAYAAEAMLDAEDAAKSSSNEVRQ